MATKVNGLILKVNPGNDTQYSIASTAYGYCETPAATKDKVVDMTGFTLLEGTTIHVKFLYANTASAPTLNVNGTGAKNIVQYGTTAVGTSSATNGWYPGAVVSFTYDGTSWVRDLGFNTDIDTLGLYIRYPVGTYKPATPLYRYLILLLRDETTLVPVNTANVTSANVTKVVTTESFNPFGIIGYYNSTTTVNINLAINLAYLYCLYIVDLRYSFNLDTSLISLKDVYLIAEISDSILPSGSLFAKLPTDISPITQTIPHDVYDKSYIYIKLGHAYSTTQIVLTYDHPIYYVDENGIIKPFVGATQDNAFMYITDNPSSSVSYSNTSTTNGNTYIRLFNAHSFHQTVTTFTRGNAINITGAGSVDVSSDTDGVITINGTNTIYTFTNGTNGTFSVTPSGGSALTVSIGKPATAGTADAVPWSGITGKPSTFTPTSHTHGNISNDGKISTTATIATGDRLVIIDSDTTAGSAVTGSSITFDGSTKTKALTLAGTWETFNNYSHPTSSGNKHIPAGGSSGLILRWSADGTAAWGADNDTKYTAGSGLALSTANLFSIASGGVTNAMLAGSIANEKLVNSKITISGVDVSLGGSITLADLGLSSAMHFIGKTTTALTDGASTNPIVIASKNVTAKTGDVVLSGSNKEYVFDGTNWEELGDESSFKVKQTAYADSTGTAESSTATRFVYSVSQDANGVVSFKTRPLPTYNNYTLPTASSSVKGGVKVGTTLAISSEVLNLAAVTLSDTTDSAAPTHGGSFTAIGGVSVDSYGRVTGVQTKTITLPADNNTDTLVRQTAKSDDINYKLLMGANSNPTSGSAYEAVYDTAITVNPSTDTITATNFAGNATSATKATNDSSGNKIIDTYATKAAAVTGVSWNTSTKKLLKTINSTTTDVLEFAAGSNITLTAAAGKITIASSYTNDRDPGYGKVTVGAASSSTSAITANTNTINATNYNEKITVNPGNKWIQLGAADSATAGSDTLTIAHSTSGVSSGNYGDNSNQTPGYGGTFSVPYISVDAAGHITSISSHTVKIPASDNTQNVKLDTTHKAFITGVTTTPTTTPAAMEAVADTDVYLTTTAGLLNAKTYVVDTHVILLYNTITSALDFVFI